MQSVSFCSPGNQYLFIMRHYRLPQTKLLQTDERVRSYSGEHILHMRKKKKLLQASTKKIADLFVKKKLYKFYTFLYIYSIRLIVGAELASISW